MLSIAAARIGWGPVTALELDPRAAEVIAANARANGVEVEVRSPFDLLAEQPPWAPTVLANLTPALHRDIPPAGAAAGAADRLGDARPLRRRRRVAVRAAARGRPRDRGRVGVVGDARMIRLAIRVSRDQAELVLAELAELAPAGLEEREVDADTVEYAIYGAPGELPPLPDLKAAAGGALVDVSTTELADDWDVRWRPGPGGRRRGGGRTLRVRPPWEAAQPGTIDVAIEPAQAFGTGAHETTRLSLALLMELRAKGVGHLLALADWGCGSGVLAIAAAKLGFGPVLACDVEEASVVATREGARDNGVEVEASRCDLRRAPGPWAPTVTANLVRPLLLEVARNLERPPERLVVSGLLRAEADEVAAAFAARGMAETDRRRARNGARCCWSTGDRDRGRGGRRAADRGGRAPHAGADLARARRGDRRAGVPEGREPAADRRVQVPRRLQRRRVADRGRARRRRRHGLLGQPRAGARARRARCTARRRRS